MTGWRALARPAAIARGQIVLASALMLLATVAWLLTARRMAVMPDGGGELGAFGFYLGVWVVMMAAMMFPSAVPMVAVYDRLRASRRERERTVPGADGTALFVTGYLLTWTLAGVAAYVLMSIGFSREGGAAKPALTDNEVAGLVFVASAAYQLSPLKATCLRHCRSPFGFLLEHWHGGRLGALRMGATHGGWCVGCCWALMAALFAVGIMSIGWMAFVAALIAIEKLLPLPAARFVTLLLLVLGGLLLVAPDLVPGVDGRGAGGSPMSM